jgi:hypothetical protein
MRSKDDLARPQKYPTAADIRKRAKQLRSPLESADLKKIAELEREIDDSGELIRNVPQASGSGTQGLNLKDSQVESTVGATEEIAEN